MKKLILVFIFTLTLLLSGCSTNNDILNQLEGEYYYKECIYLTPLSSSTLDAYPGLYGSVIYIEFSDGQIIYYGNNEVTRTYNEIEFKEEDVDKDLDEIITLDFDNVFETFEYRFDIYSEDSSVGLTIFVKGETIYLAETRMIGGSHDVFAVWSIVEIEKQI